MAEERTGPRARTALAERRADSQRRMWVALAINVAMLGAAVIGGLLTGSLALLADAGHVLSDVGAIVLGLLAGGLAGVRAGPRRTFGYQRSEVFAALLNGIALVAISVGIIVAAIGRLDDPPEIEAAGVLVLGVVGLAGNLAASALLARGDRRDLNLEGVLRHSVADALGSLAVVGSAALVLAFDWSVADPVASLVIAALILASSWRLLAEPFDVLMESAPAGIEVDELGRRMCEIEGVIGVHELHVWSVTAGFDALAAHVVVERGSDRDLVRRRLEVLVANDYGIDHTTIQMEETGDDRLLEVEGSPGQA